MPCLNSSSAPRRTSRQSGMTPIPSGNMRTRSSKPPVRSVGRMMPTVPRQALKGMNVVLMRRLQPEDFARIGGCGDHIAEDLDDLRRLLHQRRVAWRELALLQIDVVFQADPGMAAEQ